KENITTPDRSRTVVSLVSVVGLLLVVIGYLAFRLSTAAPHCPWPLSIFADSNEPVAIVTADVNFGLIDILEQKHRTLEEYLTREAVAPPERESEHGLLSYLGKSSLTSSADAVVAAGISRLMAGSSNEVAVRSARDLRPRDLDYGNFILLGSPTSNPWVSEFVDKTNFQEEEEPNGTFVWRNKSPRPGEQSSYACLRETGSTGDDYADIALVPGHSGRGLVLILQGCQQEGTESTLLFLKDEKNRRSLLQSLGISHPSSRQPIYFEALIKTLVIAGAPSATSIVATRRLY
ncbi:MAG TPA: hypothetical protein VFS41_01790, partial [Edaphobacter sp.]|nr:hypothetical protein [Edaphobacter sp.]